MSGIYRYGTPINLIERFWLIDPLTEVATPANPTTVTFTIEAPDDTETSYAWPGDPEVTNPQAGVFVCAIPAPTQVGVYRTECVGTGAVAAESPGSFEVLPPGVDPGAASPQATLGPCQSWIDGADVAACCSEDSSDSFKFDEVAVVASMLLYELSGRQFPGVCERTVRPCRQTCSCFGGSSGLTTWSAAAWSNGYWTNDCGDRCGCGADSYVRLAGYPIHEIVSVKIDGDVVSPTEYRLVGRRKLLRLSDPGPPVVKRSWPACQQLALADDQPGTFSIRYRWGSAPPQLGRDAAAALACELWKACPPNGGACKLPSGVTQIVRQGITIQRVAPLADLLRKGATGMPLLDAFIAGYNPDGMRRPPAVFSPDVQPFARGER